MGDHLRERRIEPDLVLCSPARRTRETLARLRLPPRVQVEFEEGLYAAEADVLLARVRALGDDASAVLLVAHNPGLQALAIELVGDDGAPFAGKLPTGALVVLEVEVPWSVLERARLAEYVTPREL
jgi:phosphohistidine phosphatase